MEGNLSDLPIHFQGSTLIKEEYLQYESWIKVFQWFQLLLIWLFIINIGIGLFNLLPLGPVDGGRMFYVAALAIFKKEDKAAKALSVVSILCLALIVINMIPWLTKFFTWLWGGVSFLITLLL